MNQIELNPSQIITLNDYPIYDNNILTEYFNKCKIGNEIPLVPVLMKKIVKKYFDEKIIKIFDKFEEKNPSAEYFMIDGSHRTTALTLADCKITTIIYEKDEDIIEAKKLVATGRIIKNGTLDHTLKENCEILNKHFNEKPYFMTVEQKTKKMIKEKKLPEYMLGTYQ